MTLTTILFLIAYIGVYLLTYAALVIMVIICIRDNIKLYKNKKC